MSLCLRCWALLSTVSLFDIYSVSQKIPPPGFFWIFFQKGWEFLVQILRAYYMFLSMLDYNLHFYSIICNFDEVMPY